MPYEKKPANENGRPNTRPNYFQDSVTYDRCGKHSASYPKGSNCPYCEAEARKEESKG